MQIGYARVSTIGQTLDVQETALRGHGVEKIYSEKETGTKTDRKALAQAIKALGSGDVLVVTRLDRLARSTRDLYNIIKTVEDKGAGFKSLSEAMIDTTTPHGKLILAVLAALGEFERSMILTRTGEGRARAMANGIKFGPKFKLTPHQKQEALKMLEDGKTQREVGRLFNVSQQTVMRLQAP